MDEGGREFCWMLTADRAASLPMIVRADGTNNGAWFRHRDMWVQNEDTGGVTPFHVDHRQLTGESAAGRARAHARSQPLRQGPVRRSMSAVAPRKHGSSAERTATL